MCFQRIVDILLTPSGEELYMQDISITLMGAVGGVKNIIYLDEKYKTMSIGEYLTLIEANNVDKETYTSEYFDCDNFAIALFGWIRGTRETSHLPFGLCFVVGDKYAHAINIFIADDGKTYFVEPQTDEVWQATKEDKYDPYFIMI